MEQLLENILIKILLTWLIFYPVVNGLPFEGSGKFENAIIGKGKVFVQPSDLILREPDGVPLKYQFIIDYPHPPVPGNQYYKPWNTVSSNHIYVKTSENDKNRILRKKNILYLSKTEEPPIEIKA